MNNIIQLKSNQPETTQNNSLSDSVHTSLTQFFQELDGHCPDNLYDMVLQQVEEPLLRLVMDYVAGNQSRAAECLGLNRGTLRKKLQTYNLLK
jgi:Fis family transcriptional regulator, factor for inversion stimulation protein